MKRATATRRRAPRVVKSHDQDTRTLEVSKFGIVASIEYRRNGNLYRHDFTTRAPICSTLDGRYIVIPARVASAEIHDRKGT